MSETTKPAYSPGLDGIIAGESAICSVDDTHGLRYYGYGIETLAPKIPFEDVAWLLLHGELPNDGEKKQFAKELADSGGAGAGIDRRFEKLAGEHPGDGSVAARACRRWRHLIRIWDIRPCGEPPQIGPIDFPADQCHHGGLADSSGAGTDHRSQSDTCIAIFVRVERQESGGLAGARAGYDLQFVCRT